MNVEGFECIVRKYQLGKLNKAIFVKNAIAMGFAHCNNAQMDAQYNKIDATNFI